MLTKIYNYVAEINVALLTVLSFVGISLLGGLALWASEQDRMVVNYQPYTQQVNVSYVEQAESQVLQAKYSKVETHTFVREVRYKGERFIDAWFTSVSAVCVTGLTTTDFSQFTTVGKLITLLLIQIGGLGIIVFTSIFAFAIFRGLSDQEPLRKILSNVMDTNHQDVVAMLKYVAGFTFVVEALGTLIMGGYLQWFVDPQLINYENPWWWSLFHSISAFNNAGFALNQNNLMNFPTDPVINLTIALLIIIGGLGYPVLIAIHLFIRHRIRYHLSKSEEQSIKRSLADVASLVQVRVALIGTVLLLALGTITTLVFETDNTALADFSNTQKVLISFFHSVSTRTAGFNTVDLGIFHVTTIILYMGLMFIGANPAGTAGGIKIPTVAVLYGYIKDWFKEPGQPVILLNRRLSKFALSHAVRLFFFSVIFILLIILGISYTERAYLLTPDPLFNLQKVMFEVVSAFGTVGLSLGFTGGVTSFSGIMSDPAKVLIIITMLFGRLGPLTVLASLPWKHAQRYAPLSPDYENSDRMQIG